MGWFSGPWDSRQTTRLVLVAIILLTVPCYCLGAVLLAYAPTGSGRATTAPVTPTLGSAPGDGFGLPTYTPFLTATPTPWRPPLQPTPPQLYLPTNTPFFIPPTWTPVPTWTFVPTITLAPTLTLPPSPTNTLPPTQAPTDTLEPTLPPPSTPTQESLPPDNS